MTARIFPVTARIFRSLRGQPELTECADEIIEICPEETLTAPPVLMLDEDRDKVDHTAVRGSLDSLDVEWQRIDGHPRKCGPLRRFEFSNVLATPVGFFTRSAALNRHGPTPWGALWGTRARYEAGFYAPPITGLRHFGHWLREGLAAASLCRPDEKFYLPVPPAWINAREYVDALGIDRVPEKFAMFDKMSFCDAKWVTRNLLERLSALHDRIQPTVGQSDAEGLYLRRGATGERRTLANEDALIAALEKRGCVVVDAECPLVELWSKAGGVGQTVTVEGSQFANILMTAKRGAVHLTLNPADRFVNVYADYMPAVDGQLATSVVVPRDGGYAVDVDNVLRLLDLGADAST